ncbi:DUF6022 family protein [Halalkalibacter okhensis]|uniref:Uncharacterized protein n=1 Tax=Halalkalibacter okhensis TaxID=333138 RepID=A0A0B0IK42_9BACI|nr:DUF6022 family protein [Halalkalibacter okhensis]KHF41252.1 hypothetical protein LQ50_05705 [Halalkalibacter okhensis]
MKRVNIHPNMTIEEVGQAGTHYLNDHWKAVLKEHAPELEKLFPEYEDATYGMYLDKLIPPIWQELQQNGYQSADETKENDFIIAGCFNFNNSLEKAKWGTPAHETRIFWIVLKDQHEEQIGTLLFELSHSHVEFALPAPPKFMVFSGTERNEIMEEIRKLKEE